MSKISPKPKAEERDRNDTMRISDLIEKLTKYKEERGDLKLAFSVRDAFKIYGVSMSPSWRWGDEWWDGIQCNDEWGTMRFYLDSEKDHSTGEEKDPLVTYRKA